MKSRYTTVIKRLESIVAELECEFLYLLNDMYSEPDAPSSQLQSSVLKLRLARDFINSAAAEAHSYVGMVAAE